MVHRTKLNYRVLEALYHGELMMRQIDIIKTHNEEPITKNTRTGYTHAIWRLVKAGYVDAHRANLLVHLFEPTQLGEELYEQWRPSLRRCRLCGLETNDVNQLILFKKDRRSRHGVANLCLRCANEPERTPTMGNPQRKPSPKHPNRVPKL